MALGPQNRAPSALQIIGKLGGIGSQGGGVDVAFQAIGRIGRALINQDIKNQVVNVTKQATAAGARDAAQVYSAGDIVKLRQDQTVAAEAYNKSLQTGYLENLDLGLKQRTVELQRQHATDPAGFVKAYDGEVAAMRANLPATWQPTFDLAAGKQRLIAVDRLTGAAIKQSAAEANATHMQASDTYLGEMSDALRRGDMAAAHTAKVQVLTAINARTDLTPQAKVKTTEILQREWQRQSVLGEFDKALAGSPEAASAFIGAFAKSDTIQNPDTRARVVNEMSAKLRDVVNAQNVAAKQQAAQIKSENAAKISSLEININRGVAGQADVAKADRAGLFVGNLQARVRLYKAVDKTVLVQQKAADQAALGASFMAGKALADPRNKADRKAVDAYYTATVVPSMAKMTGSEAASTITDIVKRTGLVPDRVVSGIRGALSAGGNDAVTWASDMVARIGDANPKALDVFKKSDIALAQTINKLVSAGVDPAAALTRAREDTNPTNEPLRKARLAEIKTENYADDYAGWIKDHYNWVGWVDFPGGVSNDVSLNENSASALQAEADFGTLFTDWFERTGDKSIAKKNALRELSRTWGVSAINGTLSLMKYAPEAYYGYNSTGLAGSATNADEGWMHKQLVADVAAAGLWDPKDPLDGRIRVVADARTAREASSGHPTYAVVVLDANGVYQPLQDGSGGLKRWYPPDQALAVARSRRERTAKFDALIMGPHKTAGKGGVPKWTGGGNALP